MRRKVGIALTLCLVSICLFPCVLPSAHEKSAASAPDEIMTMSFTPSLAKKEFKGAEWDFVTVNGCENLYNPGEARLPYRNEVVRTQYKIENIEVVLMSPTYLRDVRIVPSDYPQPLSSSITPVSRPLDLTYYSKDIYLPEKDYDMRLVGIDSMNPEHYLVYSIYLYPLKYNPEENTAVLYQQVALKLWFSDVKIPGHSQNRLPTNDVTYAMITTSSYNSTLKPYADWCTKKGYRAVIYDVQSIYSLYPGADNPEKIHSFVKSMKDNFNTKYVLLTGEGSSGVPDRHCTDPDPYGPDDGYIPGDTYYACCDGTWGGGGGYGNTGQIDDAIPDVYISRIAVNSASDLQAFVTETINYEKTPPSGSWTSHLTMVGPDCGGNGDPSNQLNTFYNTYLQSEFATVKKLINQVQPPNPSNIASEINSGTSFLLELSHGDPDGWYDGMGQCIWSSSDVGSLSNGLKKPLVFSMSCSSNSWDNNECVGEVFSETPGKAALAYSGSARVAWGMLDGGYQDTSIGMQEDFCRAIKDGYRHLGELEMQMKIHFANSYDVNSQQNALHCWNSYDMLGDALVPLWTEDAKTFAVTPQNQGGSIQVTVKDSATSNPVENARVCIYREPDVYAVGDTDASGLVTLTVSGVSGQANLTVTKPNYIPYETTVTISSDVVPPTVTVTAPTAGAVWTPGNHQIDWTATDNVGLMSNSISISYSSDNGNTWNQIAQNQPNTGPYTYNLLANTVNSNQCKVKVEAQDTSGNPGSGLSGTFTMDTSAPHVTLSAPAPGVLWNGGTQHDIVWTATDANLASNPINISYSTDSGASWTLIPTASGIANSPPFKWDVPSTIDTAHARIKVTCIDAVGQVGENTTGGDFTIDSSAPQVSVSAPASGAVWTTGTNQVQWTASDTVGLASNPIDVYYSKDNGATWVLLAQDKPNSGTYDWSISGINSNQCVVKVNATDNAGNIGTGLSAVFTIDTLKPCIAHTPVPSSTVGTTITITATVTDVSAVTVTLGYKGVGGSSFTDVSMSASGNTFTADIPAQSSAGSVKYHIKAVDAVSLQNQTSDFSITIMDPSSGGTLSGRVIDGVTSSTIDGVDVTATNVANNNAYTGVSQSDGTFRIQGMEAGDYKVKGSKTGYYTSDIQVKTVEAGKETSGVVIILMPTGATKGSISGTVKDSSNSPINGAKVSIEGVGETTTDSSGAYFMPNVSPGTYTLIVTKTGYQQHNETGVKVTAGHTTYVDITLDSAPGGGGLGGVSLEAMPVWVWLAILAAIFVLIIGIGIAMAMKKRRRREELPFQSYPTQPLQQYLAAQAYAPQPQSAPASTYAPPAPQYAAQPQSAYAPAPEQQVSQPAEQPVQQPQPAYQSQAQPQPTYPPAQPQPQPQPQYSQQYAQPMAGAPAAAPAGAKVCRRCGFVNEKWRLSCMKCKSNLGGL